jgi:hypothetical protein
MIQPFELFQVPSAAVKILIFRFPDPCTCLGRIAQEIVFSRERFP